MSRRLHAELEVELAQLERLASDAAPIVARALRDDPPLVEVAALAAMLHAFYNGVENLLKRIELSVAGSSPDGETWHSQLLTGAACAGVNRGPIITPELVGRLKPFLSFRHVFRHAYTFDLNWARMRPLAAELESVCSEFRSQIAAFKEALANDAGE